MCGKESASTSSLNSRKSYHAFPTNQGTGTLLPTLSPVTEQVGEEEDWLKRVEDVQKRVCRLYTRICIETKTEPGLSSMFVCSTRSRAALRWKGDLL